ncbi:ABC-type Fe3+/spermidine/putrescine transport system ATPase subunit [Arthrobacter stackebrandtii]|uniref:ABC-type Fe3+/spermidine/putrescine transport system ATPase subunit n=1 Tax=Arthrobacter stackebrandtii TaxID=272161 RepID=A0ABS4YU25_9MICC|nr:ABC transporter ATP-binding protein [Arthrobacter stackebrandtii]MBP2412292.1 ABC-type Fe3+/spermidine/putrescine transport system ATPase subunit [Arthrobacter stackebrandtii]PYH02073.1 polyamine ABC transporter ATP-binding protein [Arthrobacter stackebrandtii]
MSSISVQNVSKIYEGNHVVKNLSLEIPGGQFTSILGPSGCGKTTLLRMIAGFLEPDEGKIFSDVKILSAPGKTLPPEKRDMGMVFQQYAIWPHMSVFKNVAFGLEMKKVSKGDIPGRVEEALALVGLEGMSSRNPAQLSGGQQQRLALARALVSRPSVLLLDEPLSNLDARLREYMRVELRALQQRTGITFIYVTHDQIEAMSMSDSIAILNAGEVVQHGKPEDLYSSPVSSYVVDFLGTTNWLDVTVAQVDPVSHEAIVVLEDGTRLSASAAAGVREGETARLAIRPEDFEFADRADGDNVINATVADSMFMGSFRSCTVDSPASSTPLSVRFGRGVAPERGSRLRLFIDPRLAHVVPADEQQHRSQTADVKKLELAAP